MHFGVLSLRDRGIDPDRIYVSLERNMQCGDRALRPLPARVLPAVPRRPGLLLRATSSRSCGCVSCERKAPPQARSLEVRLLRRLPADAARLRGRAARACRRDRDRELRSRRRARSSTGPYDVSLVEGSITTAHDAERIQEVRRNSRGARHDRRLRDSRRDPGAAELRRRRRVRLRRLRDAGVHLDARDFDADQRACRGRLRAARLPDRQGPAARGHQRLPCRPSPAGARAQRVRRVQAPRHRLRRWSRTARRASARSRMPGAARSARPTTAAATAVSGRRRRRTPRRSASSSSRSAPSDRDLRAALPHVQRRAASRSAKRARRMSRDREAHAAHRHPRPRRGRGRDVRELDGRRSQTVQLRIYEPPRFFEALLRGRAFTEAPDITARICGICPIAYQMSAVRAMEDACGITIDDGPIRDLRRLIYCGEWLESHGLHVYMLHAPDFLGYEGAVEMAQRPSRGRRTRPA